MEVERYLYTSGSTDYVSSGSVLQYSSDGSSWASAGYFTGSSDCTISVGASNVKNVRIYASSASNKWLYINEVIF